MKGAPQGAPTLTSIVTQGRVFWPEISKGSTRMRGTTFLASPRGCADLRVADLQFEMVLRTAGRTQTAS